MFLVAFKPVTQSSAFFPQFQCICSFSSAVIFATSLLCSQSFKKSKNKNHSPQVPQTVVFFCCCFYSSTLPESLRLLWPTVIWTLPSYLWPRGQDRSHSFSASNSHGCRWLLSLPWMYLFVSIPGDFQVYCWGVTSQYLEFSQQSFVEF